MRRENNKKPKNRHGSIRTRLIASYVIIALAGILIVAMLSYAKTSTTMQNKVGGLTTAINDQIRLSINTHLKNIEDIASLTFADSTASSYDDSDDSLGDFEKIEKRSQIEKILLTNSLMNNFGDYCIVYSNNNTVGKLASSTSKLFGADKLYDTVSGYISRETTEDGLRAWTDTIRVYFM